MAEGPRKLIRAYGWPHPTAKITVRLDNGKTVKGTSLGWWTSQFSLETDLYLRPGRGLRAETFSIGRAVRVRGRRIRSVRLSD